MIVVVLGVDVTTVGISVDVTTVGVSEDVETKGKMHLQSVIDPPFTQVVLSMI